MSNEVEVFCCFLCERYKDVNKRTFVRVNNSAATQPKEICTDCLNLIKEKGLSKAEALKLEPKKEEPK